MKKSLRIFALILVLILSISVLCSCNSLDELRNNHARWTDDTHLTVEYLGQKYVKYEGDTNIFAITNFDGYYGFFPIQFITEKDVPVLLGKYFGYSFDVSRDKRIIRTWNYFSFGKMADDFEGSDKIDGWDTDIYYLLESEKDEIIEEYTHAAYNSKNFCYETYKDDELIDILCPDDVTRIVSKTAKSEEVNEFDVESEPCESLEIMLCNEKMTAVYRYGFLTRYENGDVYLTIDQLSADTRMYKVADEEAARLVQFITDAAYGEETALEIGLNSI